MPYITNAAGDVHSVTDDHYAELMDRGGFHESTAEEVEAEETRQDEFREGLTPTLKLDNKSKSGKDAS